MNRFHESLLLRLMVMLVAASLMSALNLCINASKVDGKLQYLSLSVNCFVELTKLLICLTCALVTKTSFTKNIKLKDLLLYVVPSLLYAIDNNLAFLILNYIDPATLSVVWNLKILTTSFLFRFILKRKFSELQWIAVVLLLLGLITTQLDTEKTSNMRNSLQTQEDRQKFIKGMFLVLIGVSITSLAGVYTEWVLKRNTELSFLIQNSQLYIFGVFFNAIALFFIDYEAISNAGIFQGYNSWTIIIILVNSLGGLTIGYIFKYYDNIVAVYAHAGSMVFTMLFSVLFFHFHLSLNFLCGLCVCIISLYLYHKEPEPTLTYTENTNSKGNAYSTLAQTAFEEEGEETEEEDNLSTVS